MIYADTSLLVAALAREPDTAGVQLWLAANDIATSAWVHTEFTSAIMLKRRMEAISRELAAEILSAWAILRSRLHPLAVANRHFDRAAELIAAEETGLRSGDALHAAIASEAGYPLATLDRGLRRACLRLGIACIDPLAG